MNEKGTNIIIMSPTPEFPEAQKNICPVEFHWFNKLSRKNCGDISSDFLIGEKGIYNHINSGLLKVSEENSNIYIFDAFKAMCPKEICNFKENDISLYRDADHLSISGGIKKIYPKLKMFINNNNL